MSSDQEKFVGSIDEGTSSTRFMVCTEIKTAVSRGRLSAFRYVLKMGMN